MGASTAKHGLVLPLLLAVALCAFSACDFPRGESKSLKQVLEQARARYKAVQTVQVNDDIEDRLLTILKTLESLEQAESIQAQDLKTVGNHLAKLLPHAGYTVRPAMAELMKQYLAMSEVEQPGTDATLLLASRTYSLLASELETTQFKL